MDDEGTHTDPMTSRTTFLDLVEKCDNFSEDPLSPDIYHLKLPHDNRTHGLIRHDIMARMPWTRKFNINAKLRSPTITLLDPPVKKHNSETGTATEISEYCIDAFQEVINKAIEEDAFEILHGKHSEPYLIPGANCFVHLERFAHSLFGILARGAHMTAYVPSPDGDVSKMKIWVPRRSRTLFTYPGKLDSTVAGGVKATQTPEGCIIQEAQEEASLSAEMVNERLKAVGVLTYVRCSDSPTKRERDLISPEILYLFDLELPFETELKPCDDEVEEFYLWDIETVKRTLLAGEFKTNSAVVMVDFFVRHGIITEQNEPDFAQIVGRLRRQLPVAVAPLAS